MPAIIPIPAFTDNYIWLVREGGNVAVVRALAGAVESFAELRAWKNAF
jgi:hypothetical protein